MSNRNDGTVFRRSRSGAAFPFLGSVGFVALGYWLIFGEHTNHSRYPHEYGALVGAASALFFGWCGFGALSTIIRPGTLHLDYEGYRFDGWVLGPKIFWRDVQAFTLINIAGAEVVSATMRDGASRLEEPLRRRLVRLTLDGDPLSGLEIRGATLLEILEEWRQNGADHPSL